MVRADLLPMETEIRAILKQHARLALPVERLSDDADLFDAGMTSHSSVMVMLALEEQFEVEFPDELLTREVFHSIGSIQAAVTQIQQAAAA